MSFSVFLGTSAAVVAAEMSVFAQTSGQTHEPTVYPDMTAGGVAARALVPASASLTVAHRFAAEPQAFLRSHWSLEHPKIPVALMEESAPILVDGGFVTRSDEDACIESFLNANAERYPLLRAMYDIAKEHGVVHIAYGRSRKIQRALTLGELRAAFLNPETTDRMTTRIQGEDYQLEFACMDDPKPPFTLADAAAQKPEVADLLARLQSGEAVMVTLLVHDKWELCQIAATETFTGGVKIPVHGDDEELLVSSLRPGSDPFKQSALSLVTDLGHVYADASTAEMDFIRERCSGDPNAKRALELAEKNGSVCVTSPENFRFPRVLSLDELKLLVLRGEFTRRYYVKVAANRIEWNKLSSRLPAVSPAAINLTP